MKLSLAICLLLFSTNSFAFLWGICPGLPVAPPLPGAFIPYTSPSGMIPCDMGCMGASGIKLGVSFASGQANLVKEVTKNIKNWAAFTSSYTSHVSGYSNSRNLKTTNRLRAYNAVALKITAAIEAFGLVNVKSMDHIALSLNNSIKEMGLADEIIRTSQNYQHAFTSYKYNVLLNESVSKEQIKAINIEKNLALSLVLDPDLILNDTETIKALQSLNENQTEINVEQAGLRLSEDFLDADLFNRHAERLGILYAQKPNLTNIYGRKKQIQKVSALSLLLQAQVIERDGIPSTKSTTQYVANLNTQSYINGSSTKANEYGLALAVATTQALQNSILNDYLILKREKNALKATFSL